MPPKKSGHARFSSANQFELLTSLGDTQTGSKSGSSVATESARGCKDAVTISGTANVSTTSSFKAKLTTTKSTVSKSTSVKSAPKTRATSTPTVPVMTAPQAYATMQFFGQFQDTHGIDKTAPWTEVKHIRSQSVGNTMYAPVPSVYFTQPLYSSDPPAGDNSNSIAIRPDNPAYYGNPQYFIPAQAFPPQSVLEQAIPFVPNASAATVAQQLPAGRNTNPETDFPKPNPNHPHQPVHPHARKNAGMHHGGKTDKQSMTGIPEVLAVQEFAFREGQNSAPAKIKSSRIPPSPFDEKFDKVWASHYRRGKDSGTKAIDHPVPIDKEQHNNFAWAPLINPYTQSLDAPNGTLDIGYSRTMIESSLRSMEALIGTVCKRHNGWERTVVDVPYPVREALDQFPDLKEYYEVLRKDADEALAGRRPNGY